MCFPANASRGTHATLLNEQACELAFVQLMRVAMADDESCGSNCGANCSSIEGLFDSMGVKRLPITYWAGFSEAACSSSSMASLPHLLSLFNIYDTIPLLFDRCLHPPHCSANNQRKPCAAV
jgi:hypothetical protein